MLYELFTWTWLRGLSERDDRRVTLRDISAADWDALAVPGVDAVWLMGVWQRSPFGRRVALSDPSFAAATAAVLPDAREQDVVGSAYCIRGYTVDDRLGGDAGLAVARRELADRGLALILDFVPNHVAPDHPWVTTNPEFFVRLAPGEEPVPPEAWIDTRHGPVARGRDPFFPPWPDVAQLDPMSPGLRDAVVDVLAAIAERCDGVRCDMAMLLLDDVAEWTWGARLQPRRPLPYWVEVVERVRERHPEFLLIAEAYWDLEASLLAQGLDRCYDKELYDRLAHRDAASVRQHLTADPAWQSKLVRFLENHDEPRAAATFAPDRGRAAALALLTLPGTPLLYRGQLEGRRLRTPVHLGREPAEPPDPQVEAFWYQLLATVRDERVREGDWELLEVRGSPGNTSQEHVLAWRWSRHLVVINYSGEAADGLVMVGPAFAGARWRLEDVLTGAAFDRSGDDLLAEGLYVQLEPYAVHLLRHVRMSD